MLSIWITLKKRCEKFTYTFHILFFLLSHFELYSQLVTIVVVVVYGEVVDSWSKHSFTDMSNHTMLELKCSSQTDTESEKILSLSPQSLPPLDNSTTNERLALLSNKINIFCVRSFLLAAISMHEVAKNAKKRKKGTNGIIRLFA